MSRLRDHPMGAILSDNTIRLVRLPGLALRAARVGFIAFGYSLVFGASALAGRLSRRRRPGTGLSDGDRWVRMLTRLGPSYIKIGQLLSTRRDLLPDSMTGPLAGLTDAAPPPSRRRVESAVQSAFAGRPWPFCR